MPRLRLVLVLTEKWTMLRGSDLQGLVRMAREAEDAGFDAVMLSEHVVLGRPLSLPRRGRRSRPGHGIPARAVGAGVHELCVKPSMFIDDPRDLPAFCREVTRRAAELAG